jgi:uncharacterized protein YdhG (YjbR/CyaY superfamily)
MPQNKYRNIDEYISRFPVEIQKKLNQIRDMIKELAPESSEKIAYQMPTFYLNENLVHFAAYKSHIGFYPTPSAIEAFKDEIGKYKNSKGSLAIPLDEPLPLDLLRKMVIFRVNETTSAQYNEQIGGQYKVKKDTKLSDEKISELLEILRIRFKNNKIRHYSLEWSDVEKKLLDNKDKLYSLLAMEETGGEPDVLQYNSETDKYLFVDCSVQSPEGRRSLCYDKEALESRKNNKPKDSAVNMATEMGIDILTESQYRELYKYGKFDTKTSSWIKTPDNVRAFGGAIFGDCRYNTVFVYHNGAESYYKARGFRGCILI